MTFLCMKLCQDLFEADRTAVGLADLVNISVDMAHEPSVQVYIHGSFLTSRVNTTEASTWDAVEQTKLC